MNDTDPKPPPGFDMDRFVAAVEAGPYAEGIKDDDRRRAKLYDILAENKDPMWKEIGLQLKDGRMSPRDILRVEAYRDHLFRGLEDNREQFADNLRAAQEHVEAKAREQAEQEKRSGGDERRKSG